MKARRIEGKITLTDGTVSEFSVFTDGGWQQWGATKERLGASVDILEAVVRGLLEDDLIASNDDPEDVPDDETSLQAGDLVWWTDPDDGISSGWYKVVGVRGEIVDLADGYDGGIEAPITELTLEEPVVDPVTGWVEHREGE